MKKPKDREQAFLVAELVTRYLPQSRFAKPELRMLPREVVQLVDELLEATRSGIGEELPPGFGPVNE